MTFLFIFLLAVSVLVEFNLPLKYLSGTPAFCWHLL
jgi:hypothetical protein